MDNCAARSLLLWLTVFVLAGCASAPQILPSLEPSQNERCFEQTLPVAYQVCIYDEKSKNRDLLYYLHGTGDWVHSFLKGGDLVAFTKRQAWLKAMRKNGGVPRIVTISFGRSFILNPERIEIYREIIKHVDEFVGKSRHRLIWGFSMGGHNALRLIFTYPDLFYRAVVVAPNLPLCDPFMGKDQLYICYFRQHEDLTKDGLDPRLGLAASFQIKDGYGYEDYQKSDPLKMAESKRRLPPLYLTVGDHDQFGFLTGTRKLHQLLKPYHRTLRYEEVKGGKHSDFDPLAIARFLSH